MLAAKRGCIVNVGIHRAWAGIADRAAYNASKDWFVGTDENTGRQWGC